MEKTPQAFAKIIKRVFEFRQGGTVLDVGAEDGRHALFLAAQGFTVTVLDVTDEKFKDIQARATEQGSKIETVVGNVLALRKLEKTYDIVVCTSVLHFLTGEEISVAVEELKNATKPGGLNVVSAHTVKNEGLVRAHLFEEGELRAYYPDWNFLYYWEGMGGLFPSKTGKMVQRHRSEFIAEKPL